MTRDPVGSQDLPIDQVIPPSPNGDRQEVARKWESKGPGAPCVPTASLFYPFFILPFSSHFHPLFCSSLHPFLLPAFGFFGKDRAGVDLDVRHVPTKSPCHKAPLARQANTLGALAILHFISRPAESQST